MADENVQLGALVKKLRIERGLTQEEVAKALDVTPGYISNVENGRNLMTLRMLVYYSDLTGVSLDYLARGAMGVEFGSDKDVSGMRGEVLNCFDKMDFKTQKLFLKLMQTTISDKDYVVAKTAKK